MTVGELLARMSSRELTEWLAFSQIEPIGDAREDLRAGIIASTIANSFRDTEKQKKPYSPADFMIDWDNPPKREKKSPGNLLEMVERINVAYGGQDLRKK